jgi:hypothetical protein
MLRLLSEFAWMLRMTYILPAEASRFFSVFQRIPDIPYGPVPYVATSGWGCADLEHESSLKALQGPCSAPVMSQIPKVLYSFFQISYSLASLPASASIRLTRHRYFPRHPHGGAPPDKHVTGVGFPMASRAPK